MAQESNCRIIAPTWWSLRIGPLLRRERSLRRYGKMFRAHPDEIGGLMKAIWLILLWPTHQRIRVCGGQTTQTVPRGLTIVETQEFTFSGLHGHRDMIRGRLVEILTVPPADTPNWGAGNFAAAHVRLGDFS